MPLTSDGLTSLHAAEDSHGAKRASLRLSKLKSKEKKTRHKSRTSFPAPRDTHRRRGVCTRRRQPGDREREEQDIFAVMARNFAEFITDPES